MKTKLCVLFGGRSSEYEVSLRSAASVLSHLHAENYEISTVGITKDGRWLRYFGGYDAMADGSWIDDPGNIPCVLSPDTSHHGLLYTDGRVERLDVIFPVMHGETCEDGAMQGLMTLSGVPFVGCGVAASANTMDKAITKLFVERTHVKQAKTLVFHKNVFLSDIEGNTDLAVRELGLPLFVKPARTGSSVGVSKVKEKSALADAVREAGRYDEKVLLEKAIVGQEIECAVLGDADGAVSTSVIGEICPEQEFYTYDAKYSDEGTLLYIPAHIPDEAAARVRRDAETVFRALGCYGLSRADFFYTPEGEIIFSEINAIPGFTSISMYPMLFEAAGIPYADLIDKLVALALRR